MHKKNCLLAVLYCCKTDWNVRLVSITHMIFLPFAVGIPVFAVFDAPALFRVFIMFFTHQAGRGIRDL